MPEPTYYSPATAAGYESYWGPDYYYDWGPGWVAPTPWCWWQPCGFWGGCAFWPFGSVCVYGGFDRFHHWHDGGWGRDGRAGLLTGGRNSPWWHQHAQGHNDFFGTPLRPGRSEVQMARSAFVNQQVAQARPGAGTGWTSIAGRSGGAFGQARLSPGMPAGTAGLPARALAGRSGASPALGYGRRGSTSLDSIPRYSAGGGFLSGAHGGRSSVFAGGVHRGGGGFGGGFRGGGFHGGGFHGGGRRR